MRSGVLAIDRAGRVTLMNRVAADILGLAEPPPPGTPIRRALSGHPRLAGVLSQAFVLANLPNRAELQLGRRGHGKTIGFTMSLVPGPDGRPLGAAIFFKDLIQIEHKAEQDRLKDRLAALGEMAARMAHEIRNPLAAIDVTCSLLRRRLQSLPANDGSLDLLGKIGAEVRRLEHTVRSSLEYVRPLSLRLEPAELAPVLKTAIDSAEGRCGRPGVEIVRRFAPSVPPFLMDREQLRQVFENLIVNALEATPGPGRVSVETEVLDAPGAGTVPYPAAADREDPWQGYERFAVVRVSDTGPGIREPAKSRIFFPFYTTKEHGSGVGLAMAKKIVTGHRGLIDVDDAPRGGAQFIVRLPMVLDRAED